MIRRVILKQTLATAGGEHAMTRLVARRSG